MSKRPLVFLDTETTGLGPNRRAWEIALVRRETDGTERPLEFFLPINPSDAESGALDIGRFYERHPQGIAVAGPPPMAPPVSEVVTGPHPTARPHPPRTAAPGITAVAKATEKLAAWTAGATIVGANPMFDTYVLERLLRSQGYEARWHYRTRDVEAMAVGFTGDEDLGGLAACAEALGVKVDKSLEHTAMGDVRVAMAVYDRVILGDPELHQLAGLAKVEEES